MRHWRKMTWAILGWSAFFTWWIVSYSGSISNQCVGLTGDRLTTCQAGTAIGGGIGVSLLFVLWFVGFITMAIVWFMQRPRSNVIVYGPQGQQVSVTEKEAARRITQGWSYTPR